MYQRIHCFILRGVEDGCNEDLKLLYDFCSPLLPVWSQLQGLATSCQSQVPSVLVSSPVMTATLGQTTLPIPPFFTVLQHWFLLLETTIY